VTAMTGPLPANGPAPAIDLGFHGSLDRLRVTATAVERHGGAGLFVSEAQHDPFVPLAVAAEHTERLVLGTAVAIAFARTPMSLAYTAHDLQRLSRGRLVLGLGTQIAPHIVRRFGMPWSRPAARMREYVAALRAIWDSWQTGERLRFEGDFYSHTLMPEAFSPGPLDVALPPVWVAGVGVRMVEAAAAVADGLFLHPMTSVRYRDDVVLPAVAGARSAAGASGSFSLAAMAMVASGDTEESLAEAVALTRRQIAFYASTPAYLPVLEHHGWEQLHHEAHAGMARGGYRTLGELVDDEVLRTFALVGSPTEVAHELRSRYAGVDRITLTMPFQDVGDGSAAFEILDLTRA
jgi:probable F420-dependent oxidoreductase